MTWNNNQIPSINNQIMTKIPMTEIRAETVKCGFDHQIFGHWNLFGIWDLEFGI
jgi:hypothetical protein